MNPKTVATGLSVNRMIVGLGLTLAPRRVGASWIGGESSRPGAQLMARGLGIRDLAIAAGTLRALRRAESARPWTIGALFSDGVDLLATIAVARSLPPKSRAFGIAMTGGSTAIGAWLALGLE